ncbi:MAG: PKD domain-containing protein [Salibacteraceae bacterium]
MKIKSTIVFLFFLTSFFWSETVYSQCTQSVDYTGWTHYGDNTAAWSNTTTWARSTANTNFPTFYVGPDTFINVKFSGDIVVDTTFDDDYIGFVMGYQGPYTLAAPWDMDFVLFDWKQGYQNYFGWIAQAGQSLNLVDGTYLQNNASTFPGFWVHTNSPSWQVLASNWANPNGWVNFVTYSFDIIYTPTSVKVFIDDSLYFDVTGCFKPGRIGFYNYSQPGARYSNFTYELYMDYFIESENVCLGDTARFTLFDTACATGNSLTNIDTFYWDLGDGTFSNDTNPRHVYNAADTFVVSLIASDINGCTDTSTKEIYIHPPPTASIFAEQVCLGDSMHFIDTSYLPMGHVTAWNWDFGDASGTDTLQNPIYNYQTSGVFTTELIIETNAGCRDTALHDVTVVDGPLVDFSFNNSCKNDTVFFNSMAEVSTAPLIDFYWDFQDDGLNDANGNSTYNIYTNHGSYDVEFKVWDSAGCRDSIVKSVAIHPIPEVNFFGPGVCFGDETQFIDSTQIAYGNNVDWKWDFGDSNTFHHQGTNPPFPGPTNLYDNPGTKSVSLVVTSDSGCIDSLSKQIQVYYLPVANFYSDTVCESDVTTFTQASYNQSGYLNFYKWEFGDGDSAFSAGTQHDYSDPGKYIVTFTVASNHGCEDTVQKAVRVYPDPNTAFGWLNNVCEGDELQFEDQTSIEQTTPGGDQIVSWEWVFNNSDTQHIQHPAHQTTGPQSIDVRLTTWSNYGCTSFSENTALIFPKPKANFRAEPACQNDSTWFSNESNVSSGLIESSYWEFGNGSTSTLRNPGEPYSAPGIYEVYLEITSNKGCKDEVTKEVTIPETPVVDFSLTPELGCSPLKVITTNSSAIDEGGMRYEWYIDDSLVSEEASPILVFENDTTIPTRHTLELKAFSDLECPHSLKQPNVVSVLSAPIAGFEESFQDNDPFNPVMNFKNTSWYGVRWHWDFDDGNQSEAFAPSNYFKNSGNYKVQQVVWNEYSCTDSAWRVIEIDPVTTMYIPNAFTPNNDGVNDTWFVKGFNEGKDFEIAVFNRWGNLIFESDNMNFRWDGLMPNSNEFAPIGVYVYAITYITSEGHEKVLRGSFSLIR